MFSSNVFLDSKQGILVFAISLLYKYKKIPTERVGILI
ncbi:hypothetical protein NU09_3369 [Flavobacterium beibuense]|uniref:Uncharacterized protein n=1 Tax=Flavobacterium beibuense TaxID=657326 RepID=A0A444W3Q0_9FLAO|nr:hypothetical protein NU09_3369 [Flavobacterium beibuense]